MLRTANRRPYPQRTTTSRWRSRTNRSRSSRALRFGRQPDRGDRRRRCRRRRCRGRRGADPDHRPGDRDRSDSRAISQPHGQDRTRSDPGCRRQLRQPRLMENVGRARIAHGRGPAINLANEVGVWNRWYRTADVELLKAVPYNSFQGPFISQASFDLWPVERQVDHLRQPSAQDQRMGVRRRRATRQLSPGGFPTDRKCASATLTAVK